MKILSRSLSREFRNDALGLRCDPSSTVVHESDLGHLPPVVGAYLLRAGVVGRPRVSSFHAVFHGRIRSAPDKPWLSGGVEQWSFYEPETRLFFMRARLAGLPFHVYHRSDDDAASMRVGLFGRFEIVDASGPELTQAEAVTRLNDRCLLAPATLIDPRLRWQTLDERRVRVSHEHAGRTVSAELSFDPNGDLSGFLSHDRYQSDGRSHRLALVHAGHELRELRQPPADEDGRSALARRQRRVDLRRAHARRHRVQSERVSGRYFRRAPAAARSTRPRSESERAARR